MLSATTSRLLAAWALVVIAAVLGASSAAASPDKKLKVTFVGDSVSKSIDYTAAAKRVLDRSFDTRFDLAVCRRLVAPSCSYGGTTPSTGLQAVQSYGSRLGDVLIVNVGYNEGSYGYRQGIDRVLRAARKGGASGVVWVTLRETRSIYVSTNREIRAAPKRWRQLVVADWNAYSAGKSWFGSDGLHLTPTGAEAMARFLRPYVFQASKL